MNRWTAVGWWQLVSLICGMSIHAQPPIRLDDITGSAGIDFEHFAGRSGDNFIVETVTAGLATLDYDQDGWIDVYLLNGAPLGGQLPATPPMNRMFRNVGGRFVDVTEQTCTGDTGFALGVAAGDYDNDGDQDLFVSNFGPNVLLINCGDGTFARREFAATSDYRRVGAGVALLDVDGDSNLDVYFANYIKFSFDKKVKRMVYGIPAAPGPKDYDPDPDTLYRNSGEGNFLDVSQQSGIAQVAGPGMGVVAFDFDGDHDTDVFVCNDSTENFLFENVGNFQFEEIGLLAGVAYDVTGSRQATMGADVADCDGDGHLDIVTTNFVDELPTFYRNSGEGYFDDLGAAYGLGAAARSLTWGVAFADLDLDSWPDLFIASGHLIAGIERVQDSEKFAQPNLVFHNLQGTRFRDLSNSVGSAADAVQVSRGIAVDDLDNDGDCDIVILNLNDRPQVIRNSTDNGQNFLQLQLVGITANRDAVGSVVRLQLGQRVLVQEIMAGRGYQSHFGSRVTFGLGDASQVDLISIHWAGGGIQEFTEVPAGQRLIIRQGDGRLWQGP